MEGGTAAEIRVLLVITWIQTNIFQNLFIVMFQSKSSIMKMWQILNIYSGALAIYLAICTNIVSQLSDQYSYQIYTSERTFLFLRISFLLGNFLLVCRFAEIC